MALRDAASFRDATGSVYHHGERVLRVLSVEGERNWRAFVHHPLAAQLIAEGTLVRTREADDIPPGIAGTAVLEHDRIPFVSYAFEWPFTLLQRAALVHLRLLARLVPSGFILSDATPSNVMYRSVAPVFIDVGSIVPYRAGDIWQGFRQFLQTMLYPLLLSAHKGVPHQAWLRGAGEEGLPASHVAPLFGLRDLRRSGVAAYLKLAAAAERASPSLDVDRAEVRAAGLSTAALLANVGKLERLVSRLRRRRRRRIASWADYDAPRGYGADGWERKNAAVRELTAALGPGLGLVWDVGANTGHWSLALAPRAAQVVAMDTDEDAVEALVARCDTERIRNVLPLVVDFANASPAQGWRGLERRALTDRGRADLVLALAVFHHLVVTRNLPAAEVLDEFARVGHWSLVEHVAPEDPLAQRLARNLGDGRNELPDRKRFEDLAERRFRVHRVVELTPTRTLYLMEAEHAEARPRAREIGAP